MTPNDPVSVDEMLRFLDTDVHDNLCFNDEQHELLNAVTALATAYLLPVMPSSRKVGGGHDE